jgi:BirA family biotin operon repressor/biotin-[acetyl-CoA-carboxylase] ligase
MNMIEKYNIIFLDKVDSTNRYAEKLLSARKLPEGTVIWTRDQTSGRGQGSNTWESEPGKNLTFSIILYPEFLHPSRQFLLNKAVSLGILDYVKSILPAHDCTLKWPNDVYAGAGKLGGILIQHHIAGEEIVSTIAGTGLNINQEKFSSSLPNPVSVRQLLGRELDLQDQLDAVLSCLDKRYGQLRSGGETVLDEDYNANILGFMKWMKFILAGRESEGMIRGVDDSGRLLLLTRQGDQLTLHHGEVEFVIVQ